MVSSSSVYPPDHGKLPEEPKTEIIHATDGSTTTWTRIKDAEPDPNPLLRINRLEHRIEALATIVASLLDSIKYHYRHGHGDGVAQEHLEKATRRFFKMLKDEST